jgi:hypothetical protein
MITGRYKRPVSGWATNTRGLAPFLNLSYFLCKKLWQCKMKSLRIITITWQYRRGRKTKVIKDTWICPFQTRISIVI